jgi:hypothetical protein
MKTLIVACVLMMSSVVFANSGIDRVFQSLKDMVPKGHSSGLIAVDTRVIFATDACANPEFVSKLRKKYSSAVERSHITELGYTTLICSNDGRDVVIF